MKKYFSFIIVFTLLFAACSKDDDDGNFDGSMGDIRGFVGSELLDTIVGLGMIIHPGNNPPTIEGKFLAEHVLENSNVPNDRAPGYRFVDYIMEITNQNGLEVDFLGKQVSSTSVGGGSLISGDGDVFTVYLKVISETDQGEKASLINIISGRMTSEGIYEYKFANFMIDNYGNRPPYIPNNTGRVLKDIDGVAKRL